MRDERGPDTKQRELRAEHHGRDGTGGEPDGSCVELSRGNEPEDEPEAHNRDLRPDQCDRVLHEVQRPAGHARRGRWTGVGTQALLIVRGGAARVHKRGHGRPSTDATPSVPLSPERWARTYSTNSWIIAA